jgi:hypothetical protein
VVNNFTIIDIVGSFEAALLLTLILPVPGYVIGWSSNAFNFRQQELSIQSLLSTTLAVSILLITMCFLGTYRTLMWALFVASWLACAVIFRASDAPRLCGPCKWAAAFGISRAVVAIASLADLQRGHRLYFANSQHRLLRSSVPKELSPDSSKPDGTPRKLLDASTPESVGCEPSISLKDGFELAYHAFREEQQRRNLA